MVLFIMLYKVVLTLKSVDETLVCGHLNELCHGQYLLKKLAIVFKFVGRNWSCPCQSI